MKIEDNKIITAMYHALERSAAVYDLLLAHARGQTDLTEDQLGNVVATVSEEARALLSRARGRPVSVSQRAYTAVVARRRPRARPRPGRRAH